MRPIFLKVFECFLNGYGSVNIERPELRKNLFFTTTNLWLFFRVCFRYIFTRLGDLSPL